MLKLASFLAALFPVLLPGTALAQDESGNAAAGGFVIGVAAPLSESSEILGRQVLAGVQAAAETQQDVGPVEIVQADTRCSAEGGAEAARALVADGADAVVGFLCTEALEAALPILTEAGIPTIVSGVRAGRVTDERDRTGHLVWRVAPRSQAQAEAVARAIGDRWAGEPFGLVNDGSLNGRGLSDAVRTRLEAEGMVPSTLDNYRPAEEKQFGLVRRLERTGVTRFLVAGDRPDIAIIARDAAEAGLELSLIGGEELFDENSTDLPLPSGILAVAPQSRFEGLSRRGQPSAEEADPAPYDGRQGYYGPSFVSAEIAIEALHRSRSSGNTPTAILNAAEFDTALGPVRFDGKGDSNLDLYRVFEWQGNEFVALGDG